MLPAPTAADGENTAGGLKTDGRATMTEYREMESKRGNSFATEKTGEF
jgi:hypothetical protein